MFKTLHICIRDDQDIELFSVSILLIISAFLRHLMVTEILKFYLSFFKKHVFEKFKRVDGGGGAVDGAHITESESLSRKYDIIK